MSANQSQVLLGGMLLCLSGPDARRGSSGGLPEDRGGSLGRIGAVLWGGHRVPPSAHLGRTPSAVQFALELVLFPVRGCGKGIRCPVSFLLLISGLQLDVSPKSAAAIRLKSSAHQLPAIVGSRGCG